MNRSPVSMAAPRRAVAEPVLLRLRHAGACSPQLATRVLELGAHAEAAAAKSILLSEDEAVRRPRHLVSGWACRWRILSDGRRQIFGLVLPGEGVGVCLRPSPLANTSTMALTPVRLIDSAALLRRETLAEFPELTGLLLAQADADERRLLGQIVRLGRLTALERLAHLLLELHDRLEVVGQADGGRFPLPLTQETLADMLGLSVVHVNRTVQELRRQGLVVAERGSVRLLDRPSLAVLADCASGRSG